MRRFGLDERIQLAIEPSGLDKGRTTLRKLQSGLGRIGVEGWATAVSPLDKSHDIEAFQPDMAYCRSFAGAIVASQLGVNVSIETHAPPMTANMSKRLVVSAFEKSSSMRSLITISPVLKDHYAELGVPVQRIFVIPDGVDYSMFRPPPQGTFDPEHFVATYTGSLESYKGIPTILKSAKLLPGIRFQLIGGQHRDWQRTQKLISDLQLKNVSLHQWIDHSQVPPILWKSGVALLVPSGADASAKWTSPVKLGEYLAAEVPVIASRIPALQYWLSSEVVWCEPDDPRDLAVAIDAVSRDRAALKASLEQGARLARTLSYKNRAQSIIHTTL